MTPQFTTDTTCETHMRTHLGRTNTRDDAKNTASQSVQVGHKQLGAQKGADGLGRAGCPDPGMEENSITWTLAFQY